MNRRQFIKMAAGATALSGISATAIWHLLPFQSPGKITSIPNTAPKISIPAQSNGSKAAPDEETDVPYFNGNENRNDYFSGRSEGAHLEDGNLSPEDLERYRKKMRYFDQAHPDDIILETAKRPLLQSCLDRLDRISEHVGHGNFHLLGFDEALKAAATVSSIGAFPKEELDFLEFLFFRDASVYGFQGEKPVRDLTHVINPNRIVKIPDAGHFLYSGPPTEMYYKIKQDIGETVVLTSGIRSVVKQFHLFLKKAHDREFNLSLASRSLAPPGYSFHGICDFDVGQVGYGALNFTATFTETEVFQRLTELKFVNLRYTQDNRVGVRYEPWHIKVGSCC